MKKKNYLIIFTLTTFAISNLFSCAKKDAVVEKIETSTVFDITNAADNVGEDKIEAAEEKVMATYENAYRLGDFLFSEINERGDVTSIVTLASKEAGIKTFTYDAVDVDSNYDIDAALVVDFDGVIIPSGGEDYVRESGDDIVLTSGGIYVLKGTLNDKRIRIEKGLGPKVQIVLDGAKINTDKESAINITGDCIAQIFLAEGSVNEINIKEENTSKTEKRNGVIYSKQAIVFNGKGKLIINNNFESSIESEDKITFMSGEYVINTKGDAVKADNEVIFRDGSFEINSNDDAIRIKNDKKAMLYIENANIKIKSGDKGFNSDNDILIVGGNVDIDAKGECIAGKIVNLLGGKINLKSADDAINSSDGKQDKKINQEGVYTRVMGGEINIDATMDGIDSNGDLYLEGGKVFISASESDNERIIDYNGKVECHIGFEMIGVGPGAKMQDLGNEPSQSYIVIYLKDAMTANDYIELIDDSGNVILSYNALKNYRAAIITSVNLEEGEIYKIKFGEKEFDVELSKGKNEIVE